MGCELGDSNEGGCTMGLEKQPIEASNDTSVSVRLDPAGPEKVRILIVSEDETIAKQLKVTFSEAGFISEYANSITAGCDSARSGRFQVVVSTPILADGSWKRLVRSCGEHI
jgi:ActR/RegA family two-component response regulator